MTDPIKITVLVMTYNEEKNLAACLASVRSFANQIIIVDSSSTDKTLEIAKSYGADIYQYNSPIQAEVMRWALKNCNFRNEWIIRVDSDERWTEEGFREFYKIVENKEVSGIYIRRKVYFMGKWLRFGGMYKSHFAVVFKNGFATMEDKLMDEHLIINGKVHESTIDVIEANYDRQRSLSLWTEKHNKYSTREAIEYFRIKLSTKNDLTLSSLFGSGAAKKRWFKENLYYKMPLFIRPFLYFFYRYIVQLAILDGMRGFIHTFLQGFWYRFLVDAKIYQIKSLAKDQKVSIPKLIEEEFGMKI